MVSLKQLETHQIAIYMCAILFAIITGLLVPNIGESLELLITPILGLMLYGMFSQIPFRDILQATKNHRFFIALIVANFILVPIFVWIITHFINAAPIQLGVMMVLLTPCVDYVIVFSHLGKGDAKLMLAATPILFILQMVFLPLFLLIFLNTEAASLIKIEPFLKAFVYLILIPISIALLLQTLSRKNTIAKNLLIFSSWFPVPFMAATLFVVIASQIYMITSHFYAVRQVTLLYFAYLLFALLLGWMMKRFFNLKKVEARTLTFSLGNRNSFVVLPFALSIPGMSGKLVALVVVTQTLVELIGQMFYIKIAPKIIND